MFKPTIFREYDIRGIADVELLDDDVVLLGQAFGTYMQRHSGKKISLGRVALHRLARKACEGRYLSG